MVLTILSVLSFISSNHGCGQKYLSQFTMSKGWSYRTNLK